MVIGEYTEFASPIHSEVDLGRAKYISIGDHCLLGSGIKLIAHDYSWKVLEDAYGEELPSGGMPIHIGNNVFVGANCTILGGVSIGNNVIIAAGSMVCKSLPDNTVCAGTPAKVIKSLDAYYQKRKETYVTDARKNAQYIWNHTGKLPVMDEMINLRCCSCPEQLKTSRSISCVAIGLVETQSGMLKFSRIQNSYTRIIRHFLWMHWEKMS